MKPLKHRILVPAVLAGLLAGAGVAHAQTQGVTKNEIVLGSIQDLSGPIAGFGKQARNGLIMRVEEINEAGGVHGRKIKLRVEDSGYDPKKGLLATQKLVQQDKIFAMIGTIGTGVVMASFPTLLERNVPNLFPLTAAREMYEPLHKLKFSFAAPYYDQARSGVKFMQKERGAKSFCVIYQDDDFGLEVLRGAEHGLKDIGLDFTEKTSYKRGATDFSSQVAKMKTSGCDTVVMGTIIRETIGTIGTARKLGWNPNFIGTSASYTELIHKLGGKAMDGFYSAFQVAVPYLDDPSKNVRDWGTKYKAKFNEDPSEFSAYGYAMMGMFALAAEKAGPNLTVDGLVNALETTTFSRDMFGSPEYKFSKTNHLGNDKSRIGQIQNGKWIAVSDYLNY
ncbi:MAG: ABC transporter substrate-binding protein [Burkholderiaceae bacterium]